MGAFHTHRLTTAPLALALLLALASSTSSGSGSTAGAGAGATPVPPEQAAASLTNDAEMSAAAAELAQAKPEPAIRVAATGDLADPITRVQVPNVLLAAYRTAAAGAPAACHLPVSLLAAIGEVESGSLVGRELDSRHRTSILGPVLDGNGFAAVPDTDGGTWDGDTTWDRAMGPMQFIPGTWRTFGVDGDGDGVADPQDVEDAAAATAAYLCYGGRDLSKPADLGSAVLAYNHSTSYQQLVLTYQRRYASLGLDESGSVTGLSTPVSLVTMQSLGVVEGSPSVGSTRTGGVRARSARTHRPARPTRPAGQQTSKPTKPTTPNQPASDEPIRPSATPSPSATAAASPTPSETPTPSASPSTSPSGSPTPTTSPTPTPSTSPSTSPTASPTPTPTPSPSPTPTTSPTPSPTASPTPVPIDPETGCPLVEVQADGAVDNDGEPCLPCEPTTDPSLFTTAVDGREVACVVEEPTS